MARITAAHLRAKAETVAAITGENIQLYQAYGGYGVHLVHPDTSHSDLMGGCQTAREASRFLSGMLAAVRLTERVS